MAEAISNTLSSAQSIISDTYTSARRALSSAPPNDAYLRWDAPGVETPHSERSEEEAKSRKIAEVMNRMQQHNFDKHRHAFRATHVKTQGIVKGQLQVLPDLPPHLRQGMFAEAGKTYDVAARYANEPIFLQEDQAPGPRGLSMKVFGVEGARLDSTGEHSTTQDFFFNNAPMIELTDIDTTLDIMSLREKYFDNPTKLSLAIKLRTDALKQTAPFMLLNVNMISNDFFTQSAFRFGDYYGHMKLEPVGAGMQEKAGEKVTSGMESEVLKDWLFDWFQGKEAVYDFKIQLGTDPSHHPTEDGSVVWDEATSPYQTVAQIIFPPQDSFSPQRRVFWEDHMYLSPWQCLAAHQPLGSINRLRKVVYAQSKKNRDRLNVGNSKNVHRIDEIP